MKFRKKECKNCHSEHNGRDFRIINFQPKGFDHIKAKFELKGKHAKLKCEECHQDKFIKYDSNKKRKGTYLGLETTCISCHEDVHQKTLGDKCQSCHGNDSFKPAVNFNHDNAKFQLTGAHKNVDCIKCHVKEKRNGKDFQKFTGLEFTNCTPCHKDIHNGKFGDNCTKCHNTNSFKVLNGNTFDHNKTRFPLKGAHANVKCSDCHGNNSLSKPKFDKCTDCHKDAHFGEFTA